MLYSEDLRTYDIQDFCINTLLKDTAFESFCIDTLGSALNYEVDAILNDIDMLPALPYCTAHSGVENQNLLSSEYGHSYDIALIFGISDTTSSEDGSPPFTVEEGIKKYASQRKVEDIARLAIQTIRNKMRATGVRGDYDIVITDADGKKTATGEAEDMNYILSLRFNYLENISKGC